MGSPRGAACGCVPPGAGGGDGGTRAGPRGRRHPSEERLQGPRVCSPRLAPLRSGSFGGPLLLADAGCALFRRREAAASFPLRQRGSSGQLPPQPPPCILRQRPLKGKKKNQRPGLAWPRGERVAAGGAAKQRCSCRLGPGFAHGHRLLLLTDADGRGPPDAFGYGPRAPPRPELPHAPPAPCWAFRLGWDGSSARVCAVGGAG